MHALSDGFGGERRRAVWQIGVELVRDRLRAAAAAALPLAASAAEQRLVLRRRLRIGVGGRFAAHQIVLVLEIDLVGRRAD